MTAWDKLQLGWLNHDTAKAATKPTLDGWWDIEKGFDYLYTEVSTDAGAGWTAIDGTADGFKRAPRRRTTTNRHPGAGLLLPFDAHPQTLKWPDGSLMANRVQTYDSPFSLYRTNGITLHKDGFATRIACSTISVQVGSAVK